ncbi:MAG: hypothetical protein Q8J68_06815 [Methanolobus sp.]|uniref:hypothetical protein n=1 Tax=Methanolobus sp. TaxID=1874737 RepID=UPI002731012E|nr:hypothetical protein [Methanolobus sp.]MDP2216974.1 hypothetical protein [Methanolobus sp.]
MNKKVQNLVTDYVSYWKQMTDLRQSEAPFIHPADKSYFQENIDKWFLRKDLVHYNDITDSTKIHLDLLPAPYIGDIMNAKVVIFMGNPGVDNPKLKLQPAEYEDHYNNSLVWDALVATLHQDFSSDKMMNYPYFFFNPQLSHTAGGRYDTTMYRRLIEDIDSKGLDGRRLLAKNICKFQLFPYHSARKPSIKLVKNTPSYKKNLEFMSSFLKDTSAQEDMLFIVTRGHSEIQAFLPRQKNVFYFIDVDRGASSAAQRRFYHLIGERLIRHILDYGVN